MSYADALGAFVRAAGENGIAVTLECPEGDVARFCETVFGPTIAADIARLGYPKRVVMPWIVETFSLFGLDELSDRQDGYRFNGRTGAPSTSWDPDRFVIADWAADPVTVGPDGSVCYSRHGVGSWTYTRIAADLPAFFELLATWIGYFVADHGADLHDENCEVPEDIRAEIRRDVLGAVAEADKDAVLGFLLAD
jgi:hypothetical protein